MPETADQWDSIISDGLATLSITPPPGLFQVRAVVHFRPEAPGGTGIDFFKSLLYTSG